LNSLINFQNSSNPFFKYFPKSEDEIPAIPQRGQKR
jgi:hypothetical protein